MAGIRVVGWPDELDFGPFVNLQQKAYAEIAGRPAQGIY